MNSTDSGDRALEAAAGQREAAKPLKGGPQYASEEVQRFAIDVEKVLCAKLGRPWSATGISIVSLIDELATLRAPSESEAIRALTEALSPFANFCDVLFNDWCPDDIPAWYHSKNGFDEPSPVTVGNFRRARAAIERSKP